jgi:peptidoglycan/LPS O-acetylase OafA/YrhL
MKISYRPEIDGLRALAVLSVVFYHTKFYLFDYELFKGGFIGVDIFFVISGYLITSIILKDLYVNGTFSFKYFYERRIRRILPVLLLVILFSFILAWLFLLPGSLIDFSKSSLYSLSFSSNLYFWYSGQQYGAESGFLKPLLHTWSLSVEEQYYIIFPIFFMLIFKYFKKQIIHFLIISLIISLSIADWGSKNYPSFNFYILPTRGWELLAGSILSYYEIKNGHRSKNQKLILILPKIGLALILFSIFIFNDRMFHPSFYTVVPIIGVCLIIWFSNKNELTFKILSTKLIVGIGLISYSLYLWHYPIFVFDKIIEFSNGSVNRKIFLTILLLLISIFSYYVIERPSRNSKYKFRIIFSIILILYLIIIALNYYVIRNNGVKERFPEILDLRQKEILRDPISFIRCNGDEPNKEKNCYFNKSSDKKVYLVGDSQNWNLMPDLKRKLVSNDYQFITLVYNSCFYFPEFYQINTKTKKVNLNCNIKSQHKILSQADNSIIIFFGRLPLYLNRAYFDNEEGGKEPDNWNNLFVSTKKNLTIQETFKNEVMKLAQKNKIILIYPFPEAGWDIPKKILSLSRNDKKSIKEYLIPKNYITTSHDVYKKRTVSSFELLNSIKGENVHRIFPDKLFCNTKFKNRCLTHDDKYIFYTDDSHPSSRAGEMINDLIMQKITW